MKRRLISMVFVLGLCAAFGACAADKPAGSTTGTAAGSTTAAMTATTETAVVTTAQTFTFRVNADMPEYTCTATVLDDGFGTPTTTGIVITDSASGAVLQTIVPPDGNYVFTKAAVYFLDVTFDGNLDSVIPIQNPAHYTSFDAYIWDGNAKQFVEAPSFMDVMCPVVDAEKKQFLSSMLTGLGGVSYGKFVFQNGAFVQTNCFTYTLASQEGDAVANADTTYHYVETSGTAQTVVKDFYVQLNDDGTMDENNAQLKPYFAAGSFWDLNSPQWQEMFYEIK